MSTKQILISKIITDDEIMPRDQINSKYVDDLAEASFPITHSRVTIGQPGVNPVLKRRLHMVLGMSST